MKDKKLSHSKVPALARSAGASTLATNLEQLAFTGTDSIDDRFDHLNRWTSLMMQTFAARTYLILLDGFGTQADFDDMTKLLRHQGYLYNFILCYWKCFGQSKGKRKLEAKEVFACNPEVFAIHERISDLRHEAAAHNGQSGLDASKISVVEHDTHFEVSLNYAFALPLHEYPSFKMALEFVEEHVAKEHEKCRISLEAKLGKPLLIKEG